MPQSWIDRAVAWACLSSLRLFVLLAYLAVPLLGMAFLIGAPLDVLHTLGVIKDGPGNDLALMVFAGIVISLLLCIGKSIGAFDELFQPRKENRL